MFNIALVVMGGDENRQNGSKRNKNKNKNKKASKRIYWFLQKSRKKKFKPDYKKSKGMYFARAGLIYCQMVEFL